MDNSALFARLKIGLACGTLAGIAVAATSTQPATGIRGRHGMVIDAIGLVCSTP